ncbi:hypothetical protein R3P38DRAFT_2771865 [Favolaschia claudopus]|uniref:Uncharacterized protein n=1 Tax=Favolaschia claudopus TaxID=2862362 RepID=A0AAW0C7Y2_9AGAR
MSSGSESLSLCVKISSFGSVVLLPMLTSSSPLSASIHWDGGRRYLLSLSTTLLDYPRFHYLPTLVPFRCRNLVTSVCTRINSTSARQVAYSRASEASWKGWHEGKDLKDGGGAHGGLRWGRDHGGEGEGIAQNEVDASEGA